MLKISWVFGEAQETSRCSGMWQPLTDLLPPTNHSGWAAKDQCQCRWLCWGAVGFHVSCRYLQVKAVRKGSGHRVLILQIRLGSLSHWKHRQFSVNLWRCWGATPSATHWVPSWLPWQQCLNLLLLPRLSQKAEPQTSFKRYLSFLYRKGHCGSAP